MNNQKILTQDNVRRQASLRRYDSLLPYFLLGQSIFCLVSKTNNYFTKTFYIDKVLWVNFFFMCKLDVPYKLPIIVDGSQFNFEKSTWIVQFNLTNMLWDDRTSAYTNIAGKSFWLPSVSSIFKSSIWLERELSDFTNLNFRGLSDTRRLLLDYFEPKTNWQTHITNDKNFNELVYDSCLAY